MPTAIHEDIIEPDLPIIDPHHHLWDRSMFVGTSAIVMPEHRFQRVLDFAGRYLLPEFLTDLNSGHNIAATVFLECTSMYRTDGPPEMKPLGETEFVNGVAAMAASGVYGKTKVCAGIVGHADMTLGVKVGPVLDAHLRIAGDRFKGIRYSASWDADPGVLGPINRRWEGAYREPRFREAFAELAKRGLSFDAWMLEPQLPDLIDLARAFPQVPIVLDHVGTPLGSHAYEGRRDERFAVWKKNIAELAKCQNVHVKLGGLAMVFCNFPSCLSDPPAPSTQLAKEWKPYIDTCIEAFGPKRAMFESNFPVDGVSCTYPILWNALKLCAQSASKDEKHELFYGTANRFYRLGL
jgi:predicted TIM-barrel fold metal-dependent hydrolase